MKMDNRSRIEALLERLFPICESWIQAENGASFFVDPLDGEEISAHYGATHLAAAMMLYGDRNKQTQRYEEGERLMDSILKRWDQNKKTPAFHHDFNNFALCVLADYLQDAPVCQTMRETVLATDDSNHNTVNWLPMRWFVNRKRYDWTRDDRYLKSCEKCDALIRKATNADGGIEDRLPVGESFNLQYDIATVAVLNFLRCRGVRMDLSKSVGFLMNAVLPDGDINYQGRGTNQIFAWGLWVYLLSSTGQDDCLGRALDYLEPRVEKMFANGNLMLNDYPGDEKYLWWDYHYCSVYCAHFLFWLVLSLLDQGKTDVETTEVGGPAATGLRIAREENVAVSIFDGRKRYLSERGPVVCAIWTKRNGVISKGAFGPWMGAFGRKYSNETVLLNHVGLLRYKRKRRDGIVGKVLDKVCGKRHQIALERPVPLFAPVEVFLETDRVRLLWRNESGSAAVLNFPVFENCGPGPVAGLSVDGQHVQVIPVGKIKNQYGWCDLYQSRERTGVVWELTIPV